MFKVEYSKQAVRFLRRSGATHRILPKIEKLREEPVVHDSKYIKGFKEKLFRIRIGDFRVLYEVDYGSKIIGIVKIEKRSRVY
tara:strand:+ start:4236 stop:4484 length:249 start_codon:yes stop_codon:yes gene_type:complete